MTDRVYSAKPADEVDPLHKTQFVTEKPEPTMGIRMHIALAADCNSRFNLNLQQLAIMQHYCLLAETYYSLFLVKTTQHLLLVHNTMYAKNTETKQE